jgi:hypothetical protein
MLQADITVTGCRADYAGGDVRHAQPSWTQGVRVTAVVTRTTVTRRTFICEAMSGAGFPTLRQAVISRCNAMVEHRGLHRRAFALVSGHEPALPNVAGQPAKRWRATTGPKSRAELARVSGSQRAYAIVKDGVIRVWCGIVLGYPGVLDLQADGDRRASCSGTARLAGQRRPGEDSGECQVLLRDLLVEIEDRQDHWDGGDAE